ncbi:hypothetical protein LC087_10315 [Bacillus carboniphilus]|uniref:Uncharacterized protein n=1 Tax=Bacillus carboniphilus TaxID=86663 RepID=A0ABY9JPI4_9BACI|nr:hypothetical protein [Bacillus carboniphilus]WLR41320.1 hypothetical protein LC087_10315 [Bacillus carboniphilus]
MLSIEEQMRLKKLAEILDGQVTDSPKSKRRNYVDDRLRDVLGRFMSTESSIKEESELNWDRDIKIVRVKDGYGSYLVKDRLFTAEDVCNFVAVGAVILGGLWLFK